MRLDFVTFIRIVVAAILVAIAVWMCSCKVQDCTPETIVRDTIVAIAPDSASIKALLECDSAGNVLIRELTEAQGKNVKLQLSLQQASGNGVVTIDCTQGCPEQLRFEV